MLRFFRVTVHGTSGMNRTNLQTGFYDAGALQSLFGEVSAKSQQGATSKAKSAVSVVLEIDPLTGDMRRLEENQRFTILFGANGDALAQQISAFATSEAQGEVLARLIASAAGRDTYVELLTVQAAVENATNRNAAVKKALEAATISGEGEAEQAALSRRRQLLLAVAKAINEAGVIVAMPTPIDTESQLDQAQAVLQATLAGMQTGGAR